MSCGRLDGVTDVGAHVGRAIGVGPVGHANTGELWVGIDTSADYDATVASIRGVVDGYPGHVARRSSRTRTRGSSEVLSETGIGSATSSSASTARSQDVLRTRGGGGEAGRRRRRRRRRRAASSSPPRSRRSRSRWTSPRRRGHGIKPGDVRRAAATLLGGHSCRQPVRGAEGVRGRRLGHARDPHQPDQHPRAPDRHARRSARFAWVTWRTCASRPTPTVIQRAVGLALPRHRRERQRA